MVQILDDASRRIAVLFVISFVGLGYVLANLPEYTPPPPGFLLSDRTCITGGWKLGLILTHITTFVLMPVAMRVFYESLTAMKMPRGSIFASQLGLAFIMASIASEIGWHVTQCWYYTDNFTMGNFMFYFFLLSAFVLWSDAMVRTPTKMTDILNVVFAIGLIIVCVLYPIGYLKGESSYKTPIYIVLTVALAVLTHRGYILLDEDKRVFWLPVLSIGVNLSFIFLLQQSGGDPYTDPRVIPNALFHILHDLLGTLAGVAVFTYLVYLKGVEHSGNPQAERLL